MMNEVKVGDYTGTVMKFSSPCGRIILALQKTIISYESFGSEEFRSTFIKYNLQKKVTH